VARSGGGYCSEAIAFVQGLVNSSSGIHVSIDQHGDSVNNAFVKQLPPRVSASLIQLYRNHHNPMEAISVCHSEPGAWWPSKYPTSRCPPIGSAYSVGRTMFETDRLPSGWDERLNAMDEVWVPTEFHKRIFAQGGVDPSKLFVLGEPVDTDLFNPDAVEPLSVISPNDTVRFLSVFKWEYRKGWDVLLKAYLGGFSFNESVVLYILTSEYHSTGDFHREIQSFQREQLACSNVDSMDDEVLVRHGGGDGVHSSAIDDRLPRPSTFCIDYDGAGPVSDDAIELRKSIRRLSPAHLPRVRLVRKLSFSELVSAYRSATAFVLPSRGEGWGRPHVEAMAMRLPVLATNWSGPTEFLDERTGFPIPLTHLRPIPGGPFKGHLMAEPCEECLRDAMRFVATHPEEARERGRAAREHMRANFSSQRFTDEILGHVARISGLLGRARGEEL
jgi:glycosyltransferase involved in cell wall biosynthesis